MPNQYTHANSSGESPEIFDTSETGVSSFRQAVKPLHHSVIVLSSSPLLVSTWPMVPVSEARP